MHVKVHGVYQHASNNINKQPKGDLKMQITKRIFKNAIELNYSTLNFICQEQMCPKLDTLTKRRKHLEV